MMERRLDSGAARDLLETIMRQSISGPPLPITGAYTRKDGSPHTKQLAIRGDLQGIAAGRVSDATLKLERGERQ
jgi:hypothetical protein